MKRLDFFKKVEELISHPNKFYDTISKDKNPWNVFRYYFVFVLIGIITNILFLLPHIIRSNMNLPIEKFILFIIVLVFSIFLFILLITLTSFISFGFYHVMIKIFAGKEKFKQSYKLLYAKTPIMLAFLIPIFGAFKWLFFFILAIAYIDSAYINFIGLKKLQKMPTENALTLVIIMTIVHISLFIFIFNLDILPF